MSKNSPNIVPPGKDNPIGSAGAFSLASSSGGSGGGVLKSLGTRLNARGMSWNAARAALEVAKVEATRDMAIKEMELKAQAEGQQREHEALLKATRMNNTHAARMAKLENQVALQQQAQATIHTHGILDRMVTDFPDADLNFETERGQTIKITRPKGASSESSEGGSFL